MPDEIASNEIWTGFSRLELTLWRARAQRAAIDWAAGRLDGAVGDVLEVGLGNGRSFDHLRERLPGRRLWAIERKPAPHPGCEPEEELLLVGEAGEELERLAGADFALIHVDLGRPGRATPHTEALAAALSPEGGVLISTDPLSSPRLRVIRNAPPGLSKQEEALIYLYERAS